LRVLILLIGLLAANVQAAEIQGVPFVRQSPGTCGPAALASVMAYYGRVIDQQRIAEATYTAQFKGALITDLENFARSQGFRTELGQGTIDAIKAVIGRRRPVIVLVDLGIWVVSRPHYLVLTGYDSEGFIAHTGYRPDEHIQYQKFEKIWARQGSTYLIVWPS
jgi:ABC-type bacteriocin/lantibiotic exporter with double-glycine peptidase domain